MKTPRNYIIPTVYEFTENGMRASDIYSKLLDERVVFLNGEVNEFNTNLIVSQLLYLESVDPEKDITLYIHSPGGCVHSGLQVIDTMRLIKPDVSTMVTGMAASMGFLIASAGAEGKRFALPNAYFMAHQISYGASGNQQDIAVTYENAKELNEVVIKIMAENCGKTVAQIKKDTIRDKWMNAKAAVKYGVIDKVITSRE